MFRRDIPKENIWFGIDPWCDVRQLVEKHGTPLYVYDLNIVEHNYRMLQAAIPYEPVQIHYAMMCNPHPAILQKMKALGAHLQVSTLKEYHLGIEAGFERERISATTTNLHSWTQCNLSRGMVAINYDSVEEIEYFGRSMCISSQPDTMNIGIRVFMDLPVPDGVTNRSCPGRQRIGVKREKFRQVLELAKRHRLKVVGVHGYLASNVLDVEVVKAGNAYLADCAMAFPDLQYINFGAGFGIPMKPDQKPFDWLQYGQWLSELMEGISKQFGRRINLKIEPGRSLVGDAGILLCRVTNIKDMDSWIQVGVDCGFGVFARPFIYGQESGYHPIVVVGKAQDAPRKIYTICGNSVLQNDILGVDRELPELENGDLLAILKTGAYGKSMASLFPGWEEPKEVFLQK